MTGKSLSVMYAALGDRHTGIYGHEHQPELKDLV
jgi:hypothetical protein